MKKKYIILKYYYGNIFYLRNNDLDTTYWANSDVNSAVQFDSESFAENAIANFMRTESKAIYEIKKIYCE